MGIREIRRAKDITQRELAKAVGVTETVISRYENGVITPSPKRLKKIAEYLEVPVFELQDKQETGSEYSIDASAIALYMKHLLYKNDLLVEYDKYAENEFDATKRILHYANGICELCGKEAPFRTNDGEPYLETHFVEWLSEGGSPTLDNVVALCPNCHKKIHLLHLKEDVEFLKIKARNHAKTK